MVSSNQKTVSNYKFNKQKRLLIKRQFDEVFNDPDKFIAREFILFVRKNNLDMPRIGLAFSKKFVAKASNRNRIKRVFRESFRIHQLPSVDIVAIARRGLAQTDNDLLFQRLEDIWQKVNRYYAN